MINPKYINPFFMWALVVIGASFCLKFLPANHLFSLGIWGKILSAASVLFWLYVASRGLSSHRQAAKSVAGIDKIITSGIFRMVRHPLYLAHIIVTWGIIMQIPSPRALAVAAWLTLVLILWAKLEEYGLEKKFGQAYGIYKKTTPMFLPRFWK
ncbi:MAG: isoprenylcysteine carboxylmethyltransferase family protein [Candidatus Doudnabacteria bacterium]|nr:isoprenylcysteine carboxylmethyltransferase family protein [Candidatus Doudnabacteria bacterium]